MPKNKLNISITESPESKLDEITITFNDNYHGLQRVDENSFLYSKKLFGGSGELITNQDAVLEVLNHLNKFKPSEIEIQNKDGDKKELAELLGLLKSVCPFSITVAKEINNTKNKLVPVPTEVKPSSFTSALATIAKYFGLTPRNENRPII